MRTITIKNASTLTQTEFEDLDELRIFLNLDLGKEELSPAHKQILDERLADRVANPTDHISVSELKASLHRA